MDESKVEDNSEPKYITRLAFAVAITKTDAPTRIRISVQDVPGRRLSALTALSIATMEQELEAEVLKQVSHEIGIEVLLIGVTEFIDDRGI
jgi:hypothetical protein